GRERQIARALRRASDTFCGQHLAGAMSEGSSMRMLAFGCFALLMVMAAPAGACQVAERDDAIRLKLPVEGRLISGFGLRRHPILGITKMHTGTDWGAEFNTSVHASAAGQVTRAGREGEYGNLVVIAHGGGVETAYAHLSRIDVKEGDCVAQDA